jgi:hypothetical protein
MNNMQGRRVACYMEGAGGVAEFWRMTTQEGSRGDFRPGYSVDVKLSRSCGERQGEKMTSGKSNGASGWRTARLGGAIYINDSAAQQNGRDSAGF